ncbi:hypothetical protein HU200_028515 [Digitaria exilis]|uniref:Uncharacterized protein n=1 Tax=Digitaria exilis TaxID=1010633 RepID=A0A835BVM0_9POAL|nr:hypothetical protein HU200_028515 [Digitaria exilis]
MEPNLKMHTIWFPPMSHLHLSQMQLWWRFHVVTSYGISSCINQGASSFHPLGKGISDWTDKPPLCFFFLF